MSKDSVMRDGFKNPDWSDWIKQQAENPGSLLNDQMDAEFAEVLSRIGGESRESEMDSAAIEMLRKLAAEKLISAQIGMCARGQFTKARDSFFKEVFDFPTTGDPITDSKIDEAKATAANLFWRWETNVRLLEAVAKGRAFTLDVAVAAVAASR